MKSFLLQAILFLFIAGTAFSQIETFEDETHGATSFTVNGISFTTTGDLKIESISGIGCDDSDIFLGTESGNGGSSGMVGSIKGANSGDQFTISTSSEICLWTSGNDGLNSTGGILTFKGTLLNGETIEESFAVEPVASEKGWDHITFSSSVWDDQELTELGISIGENLDYMAIDNIAFENIFTTSVSAIQEKRIKIFPNPAVTEIQVIGIDDSNIKIIDAFGRTVSDQRMSNSKINVSRLPEGIYFISFNSHNQKIIKKIIKY